MRALYVRHEGHLHVFRLRTGEAAEDPEGAAEWFRLLPSGQEEATGLWYLEGESEADVRGQLTRWLERQGGGPIAPTSDPPQA